MTTEQPTRPARPPRPGPAFRRAALGLPPVPVPDGPTAHAPAAPGPASPGPVAPGSPEAPKRESLRDALARIPDIERDGASARRVPNGPAVVPVVDGPVPVPPEVGDESPTGSVPTDGKGLRAIASRLLNGQVPADAEMAPVDDPEAVTPDADAGDDAGDVDLFVSVGERDGDAGSKPATAPELSADAPEWLVAAAAVERDTAAARAGARRSEPPMWRRAGFGALVVLLIAAIPLLGREGYRLVTESTDGRFSTNVKAPTDPGFETEVVSTPTQILMHNDAEGRPLAATVLSLSGAEGGGAVIFVPLAAEVRSPAFGVDRVSRAFDVLAERPPDGRKQVAVQVASLLNVGIDGVVEVDDRGWAQLVAPVAPLSITNPDPLVADGVEFASGPIELTAEQVGPYLAATREGESAFNALVRHELVWTAWLAAIAESGRDDVVPGETTSGIGLFARGLADGPVTYSIVPTTPDADDPSLLRVDSNALNAIVLAAVPSPDPALPGSRPTVRLLNGVSAEAIPAGIIQTVVQIGGSVSVIGNGPTFGRDETTIVYANPDNRGYAELLQAVLGGGTVRHDAEAQDSVALTVILGRDVIDRADATTTTADIDTDSDLGSGFGAGTRDDSDTDTDPEVPE